MFRRKLPPSDKKLLRGQSLDSHTFQVLLKTGVRHTDVNGGASSVTLTSCSEESDSSTENKAAPPVSRRGRRDAVFDNKNMGDNSPVMSADEACTSRDDESQPQNRTTRRRRTRRRSSVHEVLKVGGLYSAGRMNVRHGNVANKNTKVLRRQHTVAEITPASPSKYDDPKKHRHAFSLFRLNLMKVKEKDESVNGLSQILHGLKLSEFKDAQFVRYKDSNWTDLIVCSDKDDAINVDDSEVKRRGAVWELFQSECTFLVDRLMVLKHCFLETLKSVQVEGFLMYIEPSNLFGNVEDICYVSYNFCKEFISDLLTDMCIRPTEFGRTDVLIRNLSNLSKDAGVYHTYCLNYQNALNYLERLRRNGDFLFFEKWCEQDNRCQRLQLNDLLVAPVQRLTKLPLLLQAVRHYTLDAAEDGSLLETIHALSDSLKNLEDKIAWLTNYERIHEIQTSLVWPSVRDIDHKAFIPDFLRPILNSTSSRLFASPSRQLLREGPILLVDATKLHDMYMFLFDDVLLLTKCKRSIRKPKQPIAAEESHKARDTEITLYHVYRQPIPLEDLSLYDVVSPELTVSSMTNALVLVHTSRFEQIISVLTVQTNNLPSKEAWLSKIQEAKDKLTVTSRCTLATDGATCSIHPRTKLPRKFSNKDVILIPHHNETNGT